MRILPLVFSFALFGSALLSFSIQPILGKMLLPMVGGAPAGWIVAMAFFQMALLAGYGVSYLLGRFSPWIHGVGLLALYASGFVFLPPQLTPIADNVQGAALSLAVVTALAKTILLPYLALTATTAALQRVFSATSHPTANDPYYLFVASNAGSLIGLFAYPFVLEPLFGLTQQSQGWLYVYAVVIALIISACALAWRYKKTASDKAAQNNETSIISAKQIVYWIVLAFVPCSLSMGVTTLITTDMAGIPLLWVLPLGLYLLTFIMAFAQKPLFSLEKLWVWQLNAIGCLLLILVLGPMWGIGFKPTGNIILYAAFSLLLLEVFFTAALMCHTQLAKLRPSVDKLALYYFILALGGCLAGLFHAFVLPFATSDVVEFPIMVVLSLLLIPAVYTVKRQKSPVYKYRVILTIVTVLATCAAFAQTPDSNNPLYILALFVFVIPFVLVSSYPRYLFAVGMIIIACVWMTRYNGEVQMTGRNFFGSHAVYDKDTENGKIRYFVHGNTTHGLEPLNKEDEISRHYSSYYARNNPIADVLKVSGAKEWGVIGLGSGQLTCYQDGMVTDFYEIDPDVEAIAWKYFSFLHDCPPRHILIGDGLLELTKQKNIYDMLLLDAFTSDGIPMHLLTVDAMAKYKSRLHEDGIILVHISNRYLDLAPPIAAAAKEYGLEAFTKIHKVDKKYPLSLASKWLVIPLKGEQGKTFEANGWKKVKPAERPWTDDRSSLIEAVRLYIGG